MKNLKSTTWFERMSLVASTLAIIASVGSVWMNANLSENIERKLTQYGLTAEEQDNILKNLFDLEDFLDGLITRYDVEANELINKITPDEKLKINSFISEVNLSLSKIFIFMPDEEYNIIASDWPLDPDKLSDIRNQITILMRKTQYPDTEFNQIENIKIIYKL